MANIHDKALNGNLTISYLQSVLVAGSSLIDSPGGQESLTPLAAASRNGHLEVIKMLLRNRANPNAPSPRGRTPLYYATSGSPERNRCAIVRTLLDAGADIDACSAPDDFTTPLMNAIVDVKDEHIVQELVDRGASLTKKNRRGETAVMLTKGTRMESKLQAAATESLLTVAYANGRAQEVVGGMAVGWISARYGMSQSKDPELQQEIPEPSTIAAEEFQEKLNEYVVETGLEKFFAPGDAFLHTLAEKVNNLRGTPLGEPENIKRLARLSLYQLVVYCDDSSSMTGEPYRKQSELVSRIVSVATKIVLDNFGVELRFINSESSSNLNATQIEAAVAAVAPSRASPLGKGLRYKILEPLVYKFLLVCTITEGCPDNEHDFKDAIVECRRKLIDAGYKPNTVMFSLSQIGDNHYATKFLDGLRDDEEIEDVLYCMSDRLDEKYEDLRMNEAGFEVWLLRMLTTPLMSGDDHESESEGSC